MKLFSAILTGIGIAEKVFTAVKGKDKQNAAVSTISLIVSSLSDTIGKETLSVPEVESAMRSFIDASVNLRNVILKLTGKEIFPVP